MWSGGRPVSHICAQKSFYFKPLTDLFINSNDLEPLCIEAHHKNDETILFHAMYRPPNSDMTVFENFCANMLSSIDKKSENIFAGDLNINILTMNLIRKFNTSMFQHNMMMPSINRKIRVTRNSQSIDHIITYIVGSGIQHRSGIIKTDISDHFPIVLALNTCGKNKPEDKAQFLYKCVYGEEKTA